MKLVKLLLFHFLQITTITHWNIFFIQFPGIFKLQKKMTISIFQDKPSTIFLKMILKQIWKRKTKKLNLPALLLAFSHVCDIQDFGKADLQ